MDVAKPPASSTVGNMEKTAMRKLVKDIGHVRSIYDAKCRDKAEQRGLVVLNVLGGKVESFLAAFLTVCQGTKMMITKNLICSIKTIRRL